MRRAGDQASARTRPGALWKSARPLLRPSGDAHNGMPLTQSDARIPSPREKASATGSCVVSPPTPCRDLVLHRPEGQGITRPRWGGFMKEQRSILLVEDNDDDVELTLRALRRKRVANRVDVVRDGAEALEYLFATGSYAGRDVRDTPNLVLLDLRLPRVGGLEVLERLRADPRTRRLPWSSSRRPTWRVTWRAATTSAPTATSASRSTSPSSWRRSTSWACTGWCGTTRRRPPLINTVPL